MSDIAGIAGNAVMAYQNALATVSNNIANVATDGYSRQDATLTALPVTQAGNFFFGSGVMVDTVKRQYDAFVESNLRNTTSDLAAQGPMVNYANRVVDVMGGSTMGLNTALDQFFTSARALSTDTASTVLRSSFVRDAQGVAQRFGQLAEQLDLIQNETNNALDNTVTQMNTLTQQIGVVNGQLTKQLTEAKQPADLLDQRDLLLRKLSGLARINTTFGTNGQVSVSLGSSASQDVVVSGSKSIPIGVQRDAATPDKATLVLDPYGKREALTAVSSGTVAGLMAFNDQVLGASKSALNNLASTFAHQANTIHTQGIDGYGHTGQALFGFDPKVLDAAAGMHVAFTDPLLVAAAAQFRVSENPNNVGAGKASLAFDGSVRPGGPAPLSSVLVNNDHPSAAKTITVPSGAGMAAVATIPQGMQDVAMYLDTLQPGQELQILTRDGRQLVGHSMAGDSAAQASIMSTANGFAAGATYSDAYLNKGALQQSVQITGTATGAQSFLGVAVAGSAAGNTPATTAALLVANKAAILGGAAAIAAGITDLALDPNSPGTLLVTSAPSATASAGAATLAASNSAGMQFGAGESLNYQGMTVFYGAQAQVLMQAVYDDNGHVTGSKAQAPVLQGNSIQALPQGIGAHTITVNGVALGALPGPVADAQAVADWVNTVSAQTGVSASAANLITVPAAQLKLDGMSSLRINDVGIDLSGVGAQASSADAQQALVAAINSSSDGSFMAKMATTGELIITNGAGYEGQDISIQNLQGSDSANALGLARGSYRGQLSLTQALTDAKGAEVRKPIQLGFGSAGGPSDLAQLGFRSGAFIAGAAKDDLLVFVTGAGAATVSASYAGAPTDPKQALRANPMQVQFVSNTRYRITDVATHTVLAERELVATQLDPAISYQGLQLSFVSPPRQGDQFRLDGNSDGIGNNENILAMNALETKPVLGSKTLSGAYIDQVNEMGNIARQATISQTALTVVHDQAVSSRDQIAGVSLDKEAGDLIRYQQAYQAAAKAMQVASQLFDSVLQIR